MERGRSHNVFTIFVVVSCYYFAKCRSESSIDPFLGIAPQDKSYYRKPVISCRDDNENRSFTESQLNDNFCDCPDGTDEPGTSACPHGKFFCLNAGHSSVTLYSSRVNDGICDCCDGSDEYDGKIKCPNTCWEAGRVAREKLKTKIATFKDGVVQRSRLVQQGEASYLSDKAELSKMKGEETLLSNLVKQLKERKEKVEEAEEKQRKEKEKEESSADHDSVHDSDSIGTHDDSDENPQSNEHQEDVSDQNPETNEHQDDVSDQNPETNEHQDDVSDENPETNEHQRLEEKENPNEEMSREELGRLVASRWTGNAEKKEEKGDIDENTKPKSSDEGESGGYTSETDDEHVKYDDAEDEDYNSNDAYRDEPPRHHSDDDELESDFSERSSSWLEKIQDKVYKILQAVNPFASPVNISDAENIRREYDETNSKLTKLRSKISSLTKKLDFDFGSEKEFYSFYDQCFEAKQNKYVYKICPFKEAYQQEGHSSTQLGKWAAFENSYKVMIFSGGDRCWNGPDRSMKVKLRCGIKNDLRDVDEPSRCEYTALLVTPAVCRHVELKELEEKLAAMARQQPGKHDEL